MIEYYSDRRYAAAARIQTSRLFTDRPCLASVDARPFRCDRVQVVRPFLVTAMSSNLRGQPESVVGNSAREIATLIEPSEV